MGVGPFVACGAYGASLHPRLNVERLSAAGPNGWRLNPLRQRHRGYGDDMSNDHVAHFFPGGDAPAIPGCFLPAGGGPLVDLGGVGVHFKVLGQQTGGQFAVVEHPVESGVIVEPHRHEFEDELSFILEGTVWARVGDNEVEATAGSYVWKPRHVLHTFWNAGPEPARILEVISPAGFENFFDELAVLLQGEQQTEDGLAGLCDRYGLEFDHAWLPDIQARFGPLRLV
jgi:quercetin dioxygenase-like cupin family protein